MFVAPHLQGTCSRHPSGSESAVVRQPGCSSVVITSDQDPALQPHCYTSHLQSPTIAALQRGTALHLNPIPRQGSVVLMLTEADSLTRHKGGAPGNAVPRLLARVLAAPRQADAARAIAHLRHLHSGTHVGGQPPSQPARARTCVLGGLALPPSGLLAAFSRWVRPPSPCFQGGRGGAGLAGSWHAPGPMESRRVESSSLGTAGRARSAGRLWQAACGGLRVSTLAAGRWPPKGCSHPTRATTELAVLISELLLEKKYRQQLPSGPAAAALGGHC